LLAEAKSAGLIEAYRKENAESLSFADASYDYVFCKESYHHFPQPMKALYEMLRVARQAVVMIEPNDQTIVQGGVAVLSRMLKDIVKRALGRPVDYHNFETSGNYAYAISRREMEKVALGAGMHVVAFRGINDYYLPGVEFEPSDPGNPLFRKVAGKIARYDFLCRLGISQPGLLAVVLFKQAPTAVLRSSFSRQGFDLIDLPRNPYLTAGAVK
jgi:SAM-dependent methyltransferase